MERDKGCPALWHYDIVVGSVQTRGPGFTQGLRHAAYMYMCPLMMFVCVCVCAHMHMCVMGCLMD